MCSLVTKDTVVWQCSTRFGNCETGRLQFPPRPALDFGLRLEEEFESFSSNVRQRFPDFKNQQDQADGHRAA